MILTFQEDCGSILFPGHRFIVRGLMDGGTSRGEDYSSQVGPSSEEFQMIDLVYEITPGVEPEEAPAETWQPFTVDATYATDVPLVWSTGGSGPGKPGGPGWHEEYRGGARTLGGLGPWPLPKDAKMLTFWLHQAGSGNYCGQISICRRSGTAKWTAGPTTTW
jgi:hypothetical protein